MTNHAPRDSRHATPAGKPSKPSAERMTGKCADGKCPGESPRATGKTPGKKG